MEESQSLPTSTPTPLKITKTGFTMQRLLEEIDDEITHFRNLPIETPSLDVLAQQIQIKIGFLRNLLSAEIASSGTRPDDLSEFEGRLTELEADFYHANLHPVNVDDVNVDGENGSGSASVCESCLNDDDDGVDESSVFEAPDVMYEVVVPPEEPVSDSHEMVGMVECKGEVTGGGGGGKRWWWRTVAVLTMVSAGLMVSFYGYFVGQQHGEFLIPT